MTIRTNSSPGSRSLTLRLQTGRMYRIDNRLKTTEPDKCCT